MKKSTAENLAYTFLKIIGNQHDLSKEIIFDKNKLFTSKFGRALTKRLKINHKLSTIYHFQTNEQTKRMNQTLKQYFKHYVNYKQINGITLLSIPQFIYNVTYSETIKMSSFYANYKYNSNMTKHETIAVRTQSTNMTMNQLVILHKKLATNLQFSTQKAKKYYDKSRFEKINLKIRDKTYVLKKIAKLQEKIASGIMSKLDRSKFGEILKTSIMNSDYQTTGNANIQFFTCFY